MKKSRILITGASGCVGQYITSWLLKNSTAELVLWVRDPSKLTAVDIKDPRITLIIGDLRNTNLFSKDCLTINRVIHTATAWGDPERAFQVNVVAFKALLKCLDYQTIEQVICFSTASILTKRLELLPESFIYGTEYIQTKAQCLEELEDHPFKEKIIVVFPTLVFGGKVNNGSKFPTSYLTSGLEEATKWLWLARWIRAYSRFHFIHAADIAQICGHLATNKHQPNEKKTSLQKMVLAQPHITIDLVIEKLLRWKNFRRTPRIPLWGWLVELLITLLPIQINKWDRFSIKQRHFDHEPITTPEDFGMQSQAATFDEILADSGLIRGTKSRKRVKI